MQDHEPCGAEIIQLERALAKLVKAVEAHKAWPHGIKEIIGLEDALHNAKAHLS